ncbi:hypothetical protein M3Y98_00323600 [Aphelenchoides besseyi]|nr:hypothetical protein M3Y98_00323600 [Aphelenchoides besseyi]KAI6201434.1 hypothetical protein M3Y96_00841400 [Aphelenchoides besseyi]
MGTDLQTVPDIYRKLLNGFSPAVRNVAQTGTNLIAIRAAYFKAFHSHLDSLQELASSGTNTSEESSRFSAEITEIAGIMSNINKEDEKLFENFSNLIVAVNKFSESEKDRLKELQLRFAKDEKAISKNVKRTGDRAELQDFYAQELRKAKEQHSQRYAYFAKNYLELLRKYAASAKLQLEMAEKQILELDAADAVKRLDEVVKLNDTIKSTGLSEETIERVNSAVRRMSAAIEEQPEAPKSRRAAEEQIQVTVNAHRGSKVAASIQTVDAAPAESRPTTAASRVSSRPELPQFDAHAQTEYPTRDSPAAPPRKVLPSNIYRPTPILGLRQSEVDGRNEINEIPKIPRPTSNGGAYWNKPTYPPSSNDVAIRPQEQTPYSDSRPNYIADARPVQPVRQTEENRPPPPQYNKPIAEKPTFAVSDYGRTLECIQAHTAESNHQLSLDVGETVQLVKSGNRGWILGRTPDQRTGWFPAKFLRIV